MAELQVVHLSDMQNSKTLRTSLQYQLMARILHIYFTTRFYSTDTDLTTKPNFNDTAFDNHITQGIYQRTDCFMPQKRKHTGKSRHLTLYLLYHV